MSTKHLTVKDVATRLAVSEQHVGDLLRAKHLRGIKLSGRAGWRITEEDLDSYLSSRANVRPVRKAAS